MNHVEIFIKTRKSSQRQGIKNLGKEKAKKIMTYHQSFDHYKKRPWLTYLD